MSITARFPLKSSSKCQKEMVNDPQAVQPEENGNQSRKILDISICEMNSKNIDITENSEEKV